jgi:hypothetical protein
MIFPSSREEFIGGLLLPPLIDLLTSGWKEFDLLQNPISIKFLSERVGEWGFSVDFKN